MDEKAKEELRNQMGDNPDNLAGPEFIEGSALVYLPGIFDSPLMSARGFSMLAMETPTTPGAVALDKTVEPIEGLLNTFKVTLRIEALDSQVSNDIVLVLDTSGSMAGSRMTNTKKASIQFVNQLLTAEHPTTRISLVTFAGGATRRTGFLDYGSKQTLIDEINGLYANGGTHTQAGIHMARELLSSATSTGTMKQIVMLSDGQPTYMFALQERDNISKYFNVSDNNYHTRPDLLASDYNYSSTVGSGSSMVEYNGRIGSWGNWQDLYYNSGNSARAEATMAKTADQVVHTIAMGAGTVGTPILNAMASAGKAYTTNDLTELSNIFETIATDIQSSMRNASVNDPMGTGFHVTAGFATNLVPSQGTATYDQATRKISWNIGTLTMPTPNVNDDPNLKYAELVYQVEINDDILGATSADGSFNTNEGASVKYIDFEGNQQTASFPEPKADPLIIEMRKVLLDAGGNEIPASFANPRKFNFKVTSEEDATYKYDYLTGGNMGRVMTDIRIDGTYTLTEDDITGSPLTNLSDYDTTINWTTYDGTQSGTLVNYVEYSGYRVPRDSANKPLDTRFTITNKEKALGKLTVYKIVNNMPTPAAKGPQRAPAVQTFEVEIVGTNIYNPAEEIYRQTHTLTTATPIELTDLQYGEYTIVEIGTNGFIPTYTDSEGNATDGKVKVTIDGKEQSVTVTNTPSADTAYVNYVVTKRWVGGETMNHIQANLQLLQDGSIYTTSIVPTIVKVDGTETEYTHTWAGLPKYNTVGSEAVYTVRELDGNPYYDVTYEGNNLVVNTYNDSLVPFTVNANKNWSGGDANNRPEIWFTLYRKVGTGAGSVVTVDTDGDTITSTKSVVNNTISWPNMPKTDGGTPANQYTYYVVETNATGDITWQPNNYTKDTVDDLTVTNTYVSPKTEDLIATKTWTNGPITKPTVSLELWRRGGTAGGGEKVVDAVEATGDTYNFGPQDATDINEVAYTYFIQEVGEVDNKITLDGREYQVTYDGMNVNNAFIQVFGPVNARKTWDGGPTNKPRIGFKLYQQIGDGTVDAVSGATMYELAPGATTATWIDLPTTDLTGAEIKYSVKEFYDSDDEEGTTFVEGSPTNYENSYEVVDGVENKLSIINTYSSPLINVKGMKEWVGGKAPYPDTWLTLFRKVGTGTEEVVNKVPEGGGDPVPYTIAIPSGTSTKTEVEWTNVPERNEDGELYTYLAYETDANGELWSPENYLPNTVGTHVTNYYESPSNGELTVRKIWQGDPDWKTTDNNLLKPPMRLVLYRTTDITVAGDIASNDVRIVDADNPTATWTELVENDKNANPYYYYIVEEFDTDVPTNANWVMGDFNFEKNAAGENEIINRVVANDVPEQPDEKLGKLDIQKILVNEPPAPNGILSLRAAAAPIEFTVVVTDEYGIETPVQITAGETKNLTELYYGNYTIKETNTHGYTASYAPTTVTVIKDQETIPKFVVTNTNKTSDDTTVDITVSKEWVNGPKPDTVIELWRKGVDLEGNAIDEAVVNASFTANATKLSETFYDLAKHDPSGREFEYYAKEPTEPENYVKSYKEVNGVEDKLTIVNTYTQDADLVLYTNKTWLGDPLVTRPDVTIKLQRRIEGGAWADVPGTEGFKPDKVNGGVKPGRIYSDRT